MSDTTYTGWTNYETWRIYLELFDGFDEDSTRQLGSDPDLWSELAHEIALAEIPEGTLAHGLVTAFLSSVDFTQISTHLREQFDILDEDEDQPEEDDPEPVTGWDDPRHPRNMVAPDEGVRNWGPRA